MNTIRGVLKARRAQVAGLCCAGALLGSSGIVCGALSFSTGGAVSAWSTTANGGTQQVLTEANPTIQTAEMTIASGGGQGVAAGETFTTGATPFTLTAFQISNKGGSAVASGLSIHLYVLKSNITPSSTAYVPNTDAVTGSPNTSGDLLGVDGSGVGQGLTFTYGGATAPAAGTSDLMEFDLSGADQVTLAANTLYTVEIWNTSTSSFFWSRNATTYAGGQAYATGSTSGAVENSTTSRNQLVGGAPRFADLAVFGTVPEPTTLGGLALGGLVLLGRRGGNRRKA